MVMALCVVVSVLFQYRIEVMQQCDAGQNGSSIALYMVNGTQQIVFNITGKNEMQ